MDTPTRWYVNSLLEWNDGSAEPNVDRVLAVAAPQAEVVLIRIFDPRANPRTEHVESLEAARIKGDVRLLTADPFATIEPDEEAIPSKLRCRRDRAWDAIAPILVLPGTAQFFGPERGPLIQRIAVEQKISKRLIYVYLRKFWQRGQRKNALLPDYAHCGAPGKERGSSGAKRGRPREVVAKGGHTGINITEKERDLINRGIKSFYLKPTTGGAKPTKRAAYKLTINQFFNKGYEIRNSERLPVMPSVDELPTFRQFEYWGSKQSNFSEELKIREGERRFNLKRRGLGGDARAGAHGPGSEYQIDATPADITLVSSLDRRRIIGRPGVYFIIDVFSGMIAGFSVSLEDNSYFAAALALENAARDKVAVCAEYGINISQQEWPCYGLPEKLLADRGELISKKANHLISAFGIQVSNTPPYRADLKPFVERSFRSLNDELIGFLPGAIPKPRERGERDTRLDALITPEEFRRAVVLFILRHNRARVEKMRPRDFMIAADLEPRPSALWNWGIVHRSGHLRAFDNHFLRVNLLPWDAATVTEKGIRFRKLHFTCERAITEQWFARARAKGSWRVELAFDPRSVSIAYLRSRDGKNAEPCTLLAAESFFANCTWEEVEDYFAAAREHAVETRSNDIQYDAEYHTRLALLVGESAKKTESARSGHGPSLKGIRENRDAEKDHERKAAHEQLTGSFVSNENVIPLTGAPDISNDEYIAPVCDYDLLRQQRDELLNKK